MGLWKPVHLRPFLLFCARAGGGPGARANNPLAAVGVSEHSAPAQEGPVNKPSGHARVGRRGTRASLD